MWLVFWYSSELWIHIDYQEEGNAMFEITRDAFELFQ